MHPKIMIGNENEVNLSYVLVSPLHLIKMKFSSCSNGSGQCGISEICMPCWHWWISDKQKSTKSYHVHAVTSIKDVILCFIIRKFVMKCPLQLVTNITLYCYMTMYPSANTQCWSNIKYCVICTGFEVIKPKTIRSHCLILIYLVTQKCSVNTKWKKSRVITTPAFFPSRHNLAWSKQEQFDWGRL